LIQINRPRVVAIVYRSMQDLRHRASRTMSTLDTAPRVSLHRDETVEVALWLAFAAGCIDAYTWMIHGVMANAQTANLVLLSVYGSFAALSDLALGIPVVALLLVSLRCNVVRNEAPG
jgi:hypothetical protein